MSSANPVDSDIDYPADNGESVPESSLQFDWIGLLKWALEAAYASRPDVHVAGDHVIYPVRGSNQISSAPDVYVAFGRPKGARTSYRVWEEDNVFPQVVFEIWSASDSRPRMETKRQFYERHGAEEFYLIRPDSPATIQGWRRVDGRLEPVEQIDGFLSPRLNFRFFMRDGDVVVVGHDGRPLKRVEEVYADRDKAIQQADSDRRRAETQKRRADISDDLRDQAERDKVQAERDKVQALEKAEAEKASRERLAAKLRELGIDPDAL